MHLDIRRAGGDFMQICEAIVAVWAGAAAPLGAGRGHWGTMRRRTRHRRRLVLLGLNFLQHFGPLTVVLHRCIDCTVTFLCHRVQCLTHLHTLDRQAGQAGQ